MEFVKCPNTVPKYMICPICHGVFKDIMMSQECGHSFCKICTDGLEICAVCSVPQGGFLPNRTVRNMIEEYKDRDLPLPGACSWSGKIEELTEHRNQCDYEEIECEQDGCHHKCFRIHMGNHILFDHSSESVYQRNHRLFGYWGAPPSEERARTFTQCTLNGDAIRDDNLGGIMIPGRVIVQLNSGGWLLNVDSEVFSQQNITAEMPEFDSKGDYTTVEWLLRLRDWFIMEHAREDEVFSICFSMLYDSMVEKIDEIGAQRANKSTKDREHDRDENREDANVLESADSRGGTHSGENAGDNEEPQEIMQPWVPIHWGLEGGNNLQRLYDLEELGWEGYIDQLNHRERMRATGREHDIEAS